MTTSGAEFSPCRAYRYLLWRTWLPQYSPVLFLMLNPSTADEKANDPTVERCERRARAAGWGGLYVANLFALRSTDPLALRNHPAPVGPDNDEAILKAARMCGMVVCGWGEHGKVAGRSEQVVQLLRHANLALHCIKVNASGEPAHPLYQPYKLRPIPYMRYMRIAKVAS